MRRRWLRNPANSQGLVYDPKLFHLRPRLYRDRFPEERSIELADDVIARIEASNAAGRLVFAGSEPDSAAQ
jgi:hypothetical protein